MKNNFLNIIAGLSITGIVLAGCGNSNDRTPTDTDAIDQNNTTTDGMSDTTEMYNNDNSSGTGRTGTGAETGTGTGRTGTTSEGTGSDRADTATNNNY